MTPDLVAFEQTLIGLIYTATATVNAGGPAFVDSGAIKAIRATTPPDPYPQGWPKPFGILRTVGHSTALADETQTTSNISGTPNEYWLYYFMAAYVQKDEQDAEETLAKNVYSAIATYLRQPNDETSCIPDSSAFVTAVNWRPPTPNGPFVGFGSQVWIGGRVQILVDEYYQ